MTPPYLQPFVLDVPHVRPERWDNLDVYRSPEAEDGASRPVVVFVHGGPLPADLRPTPRDWPVFAGYASAATRCGLVAVTVDHRLHDGSACPTAAADVRDAVERARELDGVDPERVGFGSSPGAGCSAPTGWPNRRRGCAASP